MMMKTNRQSSPRALRIRRIVPRIGLALVMLALVCIGLAHKTEATVGFCITDGVTHDNITFTAGGAYTFTQCSTGFTVTGTGVVKNNSGVTTLTDKKPDRSVNAGLYMSQKTGRAVIYFTPVPGGGARVLQANQTNPSQGCGCAP
jgi:hypothetical protein